MNIIHQDTYPRVHTGTYISRSSDGVRTFGKQTNGVLSTSFGLSFRRTTASVVSV